MASFKEVVKMKKYAVVSVAVVLVVAVLFDFAVAVDVFANDIAWEDIGRGNTDIQTVLIDSCNHRLIYIGSRSKGILKSEDAGENWRNILSVRGQNRSVNFLFLDPQDRNSVYAATGEGLFYSENQGKSWRRIFQGKDYFEREGTAVTVLPYAIYLGTKGGLLVSKDKGRSWHKENGVLGNSHILALANNPKEPDCIYVASVAGAFKTQDQGKTWERIFVTHPVENGNEQDEQVEDRDEEERFSKIRYISVDPNNLNHLYLATSEGVYQSKDKGQGWEAIPDYGLLRRDVRFLLISNESRIFAVTKSGVFEYKDGRWQELSFGLVAEDIRYLALDNQNSLYAASDKGLFKANAIPVSSGKDGDIIAAYCKDEPPIHEVQQAAIKYAEVQPEKIMRWRKQAKMKALLPKLTVGLDRSESSNYEIYTSATTRYVYEGPLDKTNGWDVTLSWELGDLIWSDDQTNIDVRSRLMVQLRDDILDEVTKLYFERIRVKMELGNLPIEDRKKRYDKELRLQELTASLDALTGGYFTQQIKVAKGD
jgi:photosystem II stability/assembly factor-like uncharacterized protein